jgi:beta-phosphoglucomutase-like phosphatase (HAD superfamily)
MAVASGSSFPVIEAVLDVADLARYFSVAVSADSVPRGKPAPDLFLETARRLGVRPENCVVVEDARYGVIAARRAGMRCIAIPYLVEEPVSAEFLTADLLFPGGMGSFSAKLAFDWITGSPEAVTPNAP